MTLGSIESLKPIESILISGRLSSEPKKRWAVLDWLRALRNWDLIVLETMFLYLGVQSHISSIVILL